MSTCTFLGDSTLTTGWTSTPNVPHHQYYTYYNAYDATLSTTLVLSHYSTLIMTMLCAVTQPLDFFVSYTIGDHYWGWSAPCPTNTSGNISGNLGYFEAGTYPLVMTIQVNADVTHAEWLQISGIWVEACEVPSSYSWWIAPVIAFMVLVAVGSVGYYCWKWRAYHSLGP